MVCTIIRFIFRVQARRESDMVQINGMFNKGIEGRSKERPGGND